MTTLLNNGSSYLPAAGEREVPRWNGTYAGAVVNNHDPLGVGRVQLHIPQVLGDAVSAWAVPLGTYYSIPDNGTTVSATFIGGDPSQPAWIGPIDLAPLVASAAGSSTIYSTSAPANPTVGDIWFEIFTDTSGSVIVAAPQVWTYNSGTSTYSWVVQTSTNSDNGSGVGSVTLGTNVVTNTQLAPNAVGTPNIQNDAVTKAHLGTDVTARALGGNLVSIGSVAPVGAINGDTWIETDVNGNVTAFWTYNGVWVESTISIKTLGGISVTASTTAPANPNSGDLWINEANGNALEQWNGTAWNLYQFGAGSVTASAIGQTGSVLNSNPYFTGGDATGWSTYNGTLSIVSGGSLPTGAPFPYAGLWTQTGQWAHPYQVVPLPGSASTYQILVTVWVNSPSTTVWNKVTPATNGVNGSDIWRSHTVPANTWTLISDVVTMPAGATSVSAGPSLNSATSGTVYFAGMTVVSQVPGSLLQSGSVTPAQIGSLSASLIGQVGGVLNSNPYFWGADITGWLSSTGTLTATSSPPSPAPFKYAATVTLTASGVKLYDANELFGIVLNQQYLVTGWVYSTVATTVQVGFDWRNNGVYVSSSLSTAINVAASTWTPVSAVVPSPTSGVNQGNINISWPTMTGTVYIAGMTALPQVPGSLVQAGTITAAQIASGSIMAANINVADLIANAINGKTITGNVINGGVFNGTNWVENANGMFLYNGTPAANGLIASITPAAGTDAYGNAYFAGTTSYLHSTLPASHYLALTNDGNGCTVYTASTEAGPWTEISNISYRQFSSSAFEGLYVENHNSGVSLWLPTTGGAAFSGASLSAMDPNVSTHLEAWHNMTLINGWAPQGSLARYRLLPDGNVQVQAQLNGGSSTSGTFWNIPSGYQSTTPTQFVSGSITAGGSTPTFTALQFQVNTTTMQALGWTSTNKVDQFIFDGTYSLT